MLREKKVTQAETIMVSEQHCNLDYLIKLYLLTTIFFNNLKAIQTMIDMKETIEME
jgi:hypothetical protein